LIEDKETVMDLFNRIDLDLEALESLEWLAELGMFTLSPR